MTSLQTKNSLKIVQILAISVGFSQVSIFFLLIMWVLNVFTLEIYVDIGN